MERALAEELLKELLDLHQDKSPYLDEHWERPSLDRYSSDEIFGRERERIFARMPTIVAHSSEMPEPGDFVTVEHAGRPLLITRDESGNVRGFYNVCRHRGAQLVGDSSGCQQRFRCPYHAWTWNNSGELIAVPHEKSGFPDLDRSEFGLHRVACQEFAGWIWVSLAGEDIDVEAHLGGLGAELLGLEAEDHVIHDSTDLEIAANWKILVEGGIESYHFRVAHRDTIAPLFLDNLSSYRLFGSHMRSILPRSTLPGLADQPAREWDIRQHANILYTLFPGSQFLVQEDHFVWIQSMPQAPDRTRLRLATMVPAQEHSGEKLDYWRKHHKLTSITLDEDFELGEGIQRGMSSGANQHLNFGRFEGALSAFNQAVEDAIS